MKHTVVVLYKCYQCGRILDDSDFANKRGCRSCGCFHIKYAAPTMINTLKYFLGHKKMIFVWIKENVFHRN